MKKMMCFRIGMLLLLAALCVTCQSKKAKEPARQDKIIFHSTPDLYDLTREWAAVFTKLNPEVNIEVLKTSQSTIAENLSNTAQLSFFTSDFESDYQLF